MCCIGGSFFKNKNSWHFQFLISQIFGKSFIIFWNYGSWNYCWNYGSSNYFWNYGPANYCWNYGPSNLLLRFINYFLDQLNNKHTNTHKRTNTHKYTNTAVNSKIQFLETRYQKKWLVKVWSFLARLPQNDGPVKFLRNWTKLNGFLKLHKYQAFGLSKMYNTNKISQ